MIVALLMLAIVETAVELNIYIIYNGIIIINNISSL